MFNYLSNVIGNSNNPASSWQVQDIGDLLGLIINIAIGLVMTVSILTLLISAVRISASRSDPKAYASGLNGVIYSLIAFVLGAGAIAIKVAITNTVGIEGIENVPNF